MKPRRPHQAMPPRVRRGWLAVSLFQIYAEDDDFSRELEFFANQHREAPEVFLRRWGLDLIGDDLGRQALDSWLLMKTLSPAPTTARRFGLGIGFGGAIPEPTTIRVNREFSVDLTNESINEARDRLLRDLRSTVNEQLGQAAQGLEFDGFEFRDTRGEIRKHLAWVFRRLGRRHPVEWIAGDDYVNPKTVYETTRDLAKELGIKRFPNAK